MQTQIRHRANLKKKKKTRLNLFIILFIH